jgi:hypothetical protein
MARCTCPTPLLPTGRDPRDLLDIPADMWNISESAKQAITKYRAAVACGKIWDETDMVMAAADIKDIEAATD